MLRADNCKVLRQSLFLQMRHIFLFSSCKNRALLITDLMYLINDSLVRVRRGRVQRKSRFRRSATLAGSACSSLFSSLLSPFEENYSCKKIIYPRGAPFFRLSSCLARSMDSVLAPLQTEDHQGSSCGRGAGRSGNINQSKVQRNAHQQRPIPSSVTELKLKTTRGPLHKPFKRRRRRIVSKINRAHLKNSWFAHFQTQISKFYVRFFGFWFLYLSGALQGDSYICWALCSEMAIWVWYLGFWFLKGSDSYIRWFLYQYSTVHVHFTHIHTKIWML